MYKKTLILIFLIVLMTSCSYESTTQVQHTQVLDSIETPTPTIGKKKGYMTFWFDDAYLSTYEIAYPKLDEHGWQGVVGVVSDRDAAMERFVPEGNSIMTWTQIDQLYNDGWEISNHSRTHKRLNEIENEYLLKSEILGSKTDLEEKDYFVPSFTFPYGQNGLDLGQSLIDASYYYWRSSTEEINPIPPWRHVTAFALTADDERQEIEDLVFEAENGGWLVITLHSIVDEPRNRWQHTVEQFDMLLDIIEDSSLEVILPNQVFSNFGYAEGSMPELRTVNFKLNESITPEDFENEISLEIPKLEISNLLEIVCQDSQDVYDFSKLHEAPILICPSASPYLEDIGVPGASIIIGHRQWGIIPKIFAKLDRMQINDSVSIKTGDKEISFKVFEMIEILPEDLWKTVAMYHNIGIKDEKPYLVLITCTPYGTDWRRLLVVLERSYDEESTIVSNSSGSQ